MAANIAFLKAGIFVVTSYLHSGFSLHFYCTSECCACRVWYCVSKSVRLSVHHTLVLYL